MPSNNLPRDSDSTATKIKQLSAATLKDAAIPKHDKLKAYLDTKAKDDPWSRYTMQDAGAGASGKEQK